MLKFVRLKSCKTFGGGQKIAKNAKKLQKSTCTGGRLGGGGNTGGGGNSAVGGGGWGNRGEGPTVGASSTSKNRSSHHKYKSPKQFELKQS